MGVVDPTPFIRAKYEAEAERIRPELGPPKNWRDRLRLRRELRRLKRKYFEDFPRTTRW